MTKAFNSIDLRPDAAPGFQGPRPDSQWLTVGAIARPEGGMRPLPEPVKLAAAGGDITIVCTHSPDGSPGHLIAARHEPDGVDTILCARLDDADNQIEFSTLGTTDNRLGQGAGLGNIIVASGSKGLHYLAWRDGAWTDLGYRLPSVEPEFRLVRESVATAGSLFTITLESADQASTLASRLAAGSGLAVGKGDGWASFREALTDHVLGALGAVRAEVADANRFDEPFMARCALRLADGSLMAHTPPVLMLPAALMPPAVGASDAAVDESDLTFTARASTSSATRCRLEMRLPAATVAMLEKWRDVVTAIEVAVTPGVATYDQNADVDGFAPLQRIAADNSGRRPAADGTLPSESTEAAPRPLAGIFADSGGDYAIVDEHHFTAAQMQAPVWNIAARRPRDIADDIVAARTFRIVASLDPAAAAKHAGHFREVEMTAGTVTALEGLPLLDDGFRSLDRHIVGHAPGRAPLMAFNGRLTAAPRASVPALPPPAGSLVLVTGVRTTAPTALVAVTFGGVRSSTTVSRPLAEAADADITGAVATPPRWICCPDPDATSLQIFARDADGAWSAATFPLTRHPWLNAAYWFGGLGEEAEGAPEWLPASAPPSGEEMTLTATRPRLIVSEVGNPLFFPAANALTMPEGEIMALLPATVAMSSGQFGRFPLYFFSSAGVGTVDCTAEGLWSSPRMLSTEAPLSAEAIAATDSGVAIASRRGLTLISGASATLVSNPVAAAMASPTLSLTGRLPLLERIFADAIPGDSFEAAVATLPLEFDSAARIALAFDPAARAIYLYRPGESLHAPVYDLTAGVWSVARQRFEWTDTTTASGRLLIAGRGGIIASLRPTLSSPWLSVSRPFAPGGRISAISISGRSTRRDASPRDLLALYGSNDGVSWFPVAAGRGNRTGRIFGTRYRHYALVAASTAPIASLTLTTG